MTRDAAEVLKEMRAEVRAVLDEQDQLLSRIHRDLEAVEKLRMRLSKVESWFAAQEMNADVPAS